MAIKFKTPRQQDEEEIRQSEASTQEQSRQAGQEDDTDIYGAAKDTSVFGEAAEGLEPAAVSGEIRQSVQDVSDAARADDTYVEELFPEPSTEPDQGDGGGAAEQPDEPQGLFEDLGDIDTRQERERQAFADELEARRAEAMQQAQARAGLGGMGLSGATSELTADIGRQEARAGDIAMADLARQQSQEKFQEIQRQVGIHDLEQAQDQDLDGDGFRGNPSLNEKPGDPSTGEMSQDQKNFLGEWFATDDYSVFDPDTESGTQQEPYKLGQKMYDELTQRGFELRQATRINGKITYVDQYGNYYVWVTDETAP
jgi:hypothetical protein